MSAAPFNGQDVVNLVGRDEATSLKATLTERMLGDIQVTGGTPVPTVNLIVVGGTIDLVVLTTSNGLVLGAITPFTDALRAAGVGRV